MTFWNWSNQTLAELQDKHCIITEATQELGEQLACYLASHSVSHLVLASNDCKKLETVVKRCREFGCSNVKCVEFDAGDEQSCENLINESVTFFNGTIDLLVLNHMTANYGLIDFDEPPQNTIKSIKKITEVNYIGYAALAHLALPYMTKDLTTTIASLESPLTITVTTTRKTNIIAISSFAGILSSLKSHSYAASKSAANSYFTSFRNELNNQGLGKHLTITLCILGPIGTEDYRSVDNETIRKFAGNPKDAVKTILECALNGQETIFFPSIVGYIAWFTELMPDYLTKWIDWYLRGEEI